MKIMDAFTVTDVLECDEDEIRPVLVEFQNGRLNSTNVQHELYTRDKKTFLKVETKMSYKGVVKRDSLCNNFLVLVQNGEATLVPADYALLAPDFKVEEESEKEEADDYFSAVRTLKKEFGSKRTKLMAQQEERMRLNTSNTTKSLEAAVAAMDVDESDLETTTETGEATYIPPINRDADRVQDVYDLYTLVPKRVLNSLDENVLNDDICSIIHTDLVKYHIERKMKLDMTEQIEEHCKVLLVVDCILHFLTLPLKVVGNKKYVPCEYSQQLSKYILDTFTLPGRSGRNRSTSMKDKAMCYCIVLLAFVNKFQVNLDELCKTLKLKINKLQSIAKLLAFVPGSAKDKGSAVLKLPLPAPVKNLAHTPKRKR